MRQAGHPPARQRSSPYTLPRKQRQFIAAKQTSTTRQLSLLDRPLRFRFLLLHQKLNGRHDIYDHTHTATHSLIFTTATCVAKTATRFMRRPTLSSTENRHFHLTSLRTTKRGHHFARTLHRGPLEKNLTAVTLPRPPQEGTKETTDPIHGNRAQTRRTKATQDLMTLRNKHSHNNTPTTSKANTNHKTTTTNRQALRHRRTTN